MLELLLKLLKFIFSEPTPKAQPENEDVFITTMAWGARVSQTFRNRVAWMAAELDIPADYLMAVIAFETGETFSASVRNGAGSGATGLIQFMPATAVALGTTTDALAAMTPEDQLNYVYRYFLPYKGRLKTLSDVYMAVLWPRAIGKPEDYMLWNKSNMPTTYRQNAGLDANKDGQITKREAASKAQAKLDRGLKEPYVWTGVVNPW